MKKILEHLEKEKPERVADFKKNAQPAVKKANEFLTNLLTFLLP